MPVVALEHPSLGLTLLRSTLEDRGVKTRIYYFAPAFATAIGLRTYRFLESHQGFRTLAGEWMFADEGYPDATRPDHLGYLRELVAAGVGPSRIHDLIEAKQAVSAFIERCARDIQGHSPRIVGLTSTFQQNMASLALARAIKRYSPSTIVAFGGANCDGEMACSLCLRFEAIDIVFRGEAEESFPAFCERYLAGNQDCFKTQGIVYREAGHRLVDRGTGARPDLDALPDPDYSDYHGVLQEHGYFGGAVRLVPLVESSRGCWWGQKHHCTFCGLNGTSMAYRSKSADIVVRQIAAAAKRYGPEVLMVDNILDYRYLDSVVPRLTQHEFPLLMHCEVKANLKPHQVDLLARAGIRKLQPGIEALDSELLRLMNKGSDLLTNLALLKWCTFYGVYVDWGHLCGFPGEHSSIYGRIVSLIPALHHLHPPAHVTDVRADRFSPYFVNPAKFECEVEPLAAYRHIYGDRDAAHALAYHFRLRRRDLDDEQAAALGASHEALRHAVRKWACVHATAQCLLIEDADGQVILDTRPGPERRRRLSTVESAVLAEFAQPRSVVAVGRVLRERGIEPSAYQRALDALRDERFVVGGDEKWLSVVIPPGGYSRAVSLRDLAMEYGLDGMTHA